MVTTTGWRFETEQVRGGSRVAEERSPVTPIYQTASYVFESTEEAQRIFALETPGNLYSRTGNPTSAALERRIAAIEGGVAAVAIASGQSAVFLALLALAAGGGHIVASRALYGGTYDLLSETFADLGIPVTFVDQSDPGSWARAARPQTRAFFAETIANPSGAVLDLEQVASAAHAQGVPLVVDNTLASPFLLRPLEHGADIVVHSATKLIGGHGSALGGIIVDGGRFDFGREPQRWPALTEPYTRYADVVLWRDFGAQRGAFAALVRTRYLHDIGASSAPFNSFLLLQGVETLDLRVGRQADSAALIAERLEQHPAVRSVSYPGLASHPSHALAQRYLPRGAGTVLAFDHADGEQAARRTIDGLRLFIQAANLGDARSLAIHPATTTHAHLSPRAQLDAGVSRATIRLSLGVENPNDLIADLDAALAAS